MSNSPLVNYTRISPNSNPRKDPTYNPSGKVTVITIHHAAGDASVEVMGEIFAHEDRQASSNYGIGTDGRVALYVDEDRRPWTSGSRENDYKAVTIEVANDSREPDWHVSDTALAKLIDLCTDICKRNGIERLNFTGDKTGNLTMHKWFQATGCPGPYLGSKFPYIAQEVNKRLAPQPVAKPTIYRVQVGAFTKKANADRKLQAVKAAGFEDAFLANVDGQFWRVQVGAFEVKANAERRMAQLKEAGFSGYVTQLSGTKEPDPAPAPAIVVGSTVRMKRGAKYYDGATPASFVYDRDHEVKQITGDRVVITFTGVVIGAVKMADLVLVK